MTAPRHPNRPTGVTPKRGQVLQCHILQLALTIDVAIQDLTP